jgi:drug/metabolite transporter (DMT)-like permease
VPVGIVYILISGISFGLLPWFARIAYDHGAEPLGMLLARFSLATIGLVAIRFFVQRGVRWPRGAVLWQLIGLGAIGYAGQSSFYFFGIERIDVSLATVIFYSYPVLVVLAGWALHGTKPGTMVTVCLSIVVAGTALTAGQVRAGSFTGVLLMVGAAAWYTVYIVTAAKVTPKVGALTSLTVIMAGAAVAHVLAWPLHRSALPSDASGWWATVAAAGVSTIVAMGFFLAGVARLDAGVASVLSTIEPVVSIAVGVIALDESLTPARTAGALAVLLGVALLAQFSRASTK